MLNEHKRRQFRTDAQTSQQKSLQNNTTFELSLLLSILIKDNLPLNIRLSNLPVEQKVIAP